MYRMLPDRNYTKSTKKYTEEWTKTFQLLEKEFNITCFGYDPDIAFKDSNCFTFNIPSNFAVKITKLIKERDKLFSQLININGKINEL